MLRPLPSLLPSEVYFLEDFELNLSLIPTGWSWGIWCSFPNNTIPTPGSLGEC